MKAVVYDDFGGPEVLEVRDIDAPEANGDQVLIDVRYAGVNPFDWKIRRGYFKSFFEFVFPVPARPPDRDPGPRRRRGRPCRARPGDP